ncbi:YopX family protein, partial [Campylobacter jejuni]
DFRVWDGKKYINNIKGGFYIHKINDYIKCLKRNQDCYDYEFELDDLDNSNLEIEFFTGLYDKNGTKIYEGDILYSFEGCSEDEAFKYKVVFKEGAFYLVECGDDGEEWDEDLLSEFCLEELEIVGNIHENAELLNENKPS